MVNNAVIENPGGRLEDVTVEDWEDGLFCHLTAPLLFCKLVVPLMIEQGGGSIINVSSGQCDVRQSQHLIVRSRQGGDDQFHTECGGHLWSSRDSRQRADARADAHGEETRNARGQSGGGQETEIPLSAGQSGAAG